MTRFIFVLHVALCLSAVAAMGAPRTLPRCARQPCSLPAAGRRSLEPSRRAATEVRSHACAIADGPRAPAQSRLRAQGLARDSRRTLKWLQGKSIEEWSKVVAVVMVLGFAAYHVVNVDAHLSRGWTTLEILQRIPLDNWQNYELNLQESPLVTKTAINTGIYIIADWLAQVLEGTPPLDFEPRRLLRNGLMGLMFGPITVAYYEFSDLILDPTVVSNRIWKVAMDQSAYAMAKYFLFVFTKDVLSGEAPGQSLDKARRSVWPLLQRGWRFWPAVHTLTYSIIPPRHRVLWVNCADLVWVTILSLFNNEEADSEDD